MDYNITLTNLKSDWKKYQKEDKKIFYIGKFFLNNNIEKNPEIIKEYFFDEKFKHKKLVKKLEKIDGFYAIIFKDEEKLLLINDRVRTYPLFFAKKNNILFISDNAHILKNKLDIKKQNRFGILEFLLCGYVTGNSTLYTQIKQLLPGEYLYWNRKKRTYKILHYYSYYPDNKNISAWKKYNYNDKKDEFRKILYKSFLKLKRYIIKNNFIPVVPLSGGIDSRLIAIMLKEVGIKNAICYTYGEKNHSEVIKSKEIAKKLDFKWKFVSYTKEKWNKEYKKNIIDKFYIYSDGLSVKPHIMDFIAVKDLFSHKKKKFIFLPGHTLDFISGKQVPSKIFLNNILTPNELYIELLNKHYSFHYIYKYDRAKIINYLKKNLKKTENKHEMLAKFDYWNWRERQGKLILNSLNVYDYFGFDWYIPFWEKEFQKFFLSIPYRYRFRRYFLLKCLNNFFPDYYKKTHQNENNVKEFIKNFLFTKFDNISDKISFDLFRYIYFKSNNIKKLSKNYGSNRYGAIDINSKDIESFSKKYSKNSDVVYIHYFFALDYLIDNKFDLNFLDKRYLKSLDLINP